MPTRLPRSPIRTCRGVWCRSATRAVLMRLSRLGHFSKAKSSCGPASLRRPASRRWTDARQKTAAMRPLADFWQWAKAAGSSALPPKADIERHGWHVRFVPILLQKSLMAPAWSDSLVQTRFGVEAGDDGAAQSRPKAAVLFI